MLKKTLAVMAAATLIASPAAVMADTGKTGTETPKPKSDPGVKRGQDSGVKRGQDSGTKTGQDSGSKGGSDSGSSGSARSPH
jgi:Spy/CpxP family protein refolding chaperone